MASLDPQKNNAATPPELDLENIDFDKIFQVMGETIEKFDQDEAMLTNIEAAARQDIEEDLKAIQLADEEYLADTADINPAGIESAPPVPPTAESPSNS